jgi:hypothetical protein
MVVGRRTFTWRSDVRGLAGVVLLGVLTVAGAGALIALTWALARWLG